MGDSDCKLNPPNGGTAKCPGDEFVYSLAFGIGNRESEFGSRLCPTIVAGRPTNGPLLRLI
jgi:ferredoxin-thioredoxin reductase catalytic subunit